MVLEALALALGVAVGSLAVGSSAVEAACPCVAAGLEAAYHEEDLVSVGLLLASPDAEGGSELVAGCSFCR